MDCAAPTRARRRSPPHRPGGRARAPPGRGGGRRLRRRPGVDAAGLEATCGSAPGTTRCSTASGCSSRARACRPRPSRSSPPRARGIPVVSEIELGARLLPNPFLAVTGTNGKTTTTALLGAILEAGAVPVEVAGNIGRALTSLVGHASPDAWVVCELSSFQLEDVYDAAATRRRADEPRARPPRPARDVRAYAAIKLTLFERQSAGRRRRRAARLRPGPGQRAARRVRCRRPAAGRAAHPRASTTARTPPRRRPRRARSACPTRRSRARSPRSRGSSTGSRRSRPSTASSTSTTRRRRTPPRRSARSPRSPVGAST